MTSETRERENRSERDEQEMTGRGRNVATYAQPITAVLAGKVVTIIATDDHAGHSPVFQYIDAEGAVEWESQRKFTIIEPRLLPPSTQSLGEALRTLRLR